MGVARIILINEMAIPMLERRDRAAVRRQVRGRVLDRHQLPGGVAGVHGPAHLARHAERAQHVAAVFAEEQVRQAGRAGDVARAEGQQAREPRRHLGPVLVRDGLGDLRHGAEAA